MARFKTCLWFDGKAEEAAKFYVSIFKNSKIASVARYDEASAQASGQPAGSAMVVNFRLDGQEFMGLNGGPLFKFSEAISLVVNCNTQKEVDYHWRRLTADGGQESQCGWLKDKYGLSWQVVPKVLGRMMSSKDKNKSARVMQALLQMKKLDIAVLKKAYEQK